VLEKDCFIITQKNHEDRLRILWLVLRLSQRGGGEDGGNRCEAELSPCAICHIIYGCHVCTESTVVVVLPSKKQTNSTKNQQSTLLHSPARRRKRNMNIRNHRNQGPIAICLALL